MCLARLIGLLLSLRSAALCLVNSSPGEHFPDRFSVYCRSTVSLQPWICLKGSYTHVMLYRLLYLKHSAGAVMCRWKVQETDNPTCV